MRCFVHMKAAGIIYFTAKSCTDARRWKIVKFVFKTIDIIRASRDNAAQ